MAFKGELSKTEPSDRRKEVVRRLREELPILTNEFVSVVNFEKIDQSAKPPEKRADIGVDATDNIEETRQYLASEPDFTILREEKINDAANRVRFYLKLKE